MGISNILKDKKKTPFFFLEKEEEDIQNIVHAIIASTNVSPFLKNTSVRKFIKEFHIPLYEEWLTSLLKLPTIVITKLNAKNTKFDEYSKAQDYDAIKKQFGQDLSFPYEYRKAIYDWIERENGSEIFRNAWIFHEAKFQVDKWKSSGKTTTFEEKLKDKDSHIKTLTEYVNCYNTFKVEYNSKSQLGIDSLSHPSTGDRQNFPKLLKTSEQTLVNWDIPDSFRDTRATKRRSSSSCLTESDVDQLCTECLAKRTKLLALNQEEANEKKEKERNNLKTQTGSTKEEEIETKLKIEKSEDKAKKEAEERAKTSQANNPVDTKNTPPEGYHAKIHKNSQQSSTRGKTTADNTPIETRASIIEKKMIKSSSETPLAPFGQAQPAASTKTVFASPPPNGNKTVNNTTSSIHGNAELLNNTEVLKEIPIIELLPSLTIADLPPAAPKVEPIKQVKDFDSISCTNILLLGESGVGKTTFINSCANYIAHATLEKAVEKPVFLVDLSFCILIDGFNKKNIRVFANQGLTFDKQNEEVDNEFGSQTKKPQVHLIRYKEGDVEKVLRIVDTPGFNDTNGETQDAINLASIVELAKVIGKFHAVCVLMTPNKARNSLPLRNQLNQLFTTFHPNSQQNFIFCFTRTAPKFRPGETLTIVKEHLSTLKNVKIELEKKQNIFTFDNECMRYICAKQNDPDCDPTAFINAAPSWDHSREELFRLLNRTKELNPFDMNISSMVEDKFKILMALTHPFLDLLQIIANIRRDIERKEKKILLDKQRTRLVEQTSFKLICEKEYCKRYQNIYNRQQRLCNELTDLNSVKYNQVLDFPAFTNGSYYCNICGCSWYCHYMKRFKEKIYEPLDTSKDEKDLQDTKKTQKDIEEESDKVILACTNLNLFLAQNSSSPITDPFFNHIRNLLEKEKKKINSGRKSDYQYDLEKITSEYPLLLKKKETEKMSEDKIHQEIEQLKKLPFSGVFTKEAFGNFKITPIEDNIHF